MVVGSHEHDEALPRKASELASSGLRTLVLAYSTDMLVLRDGDDQRLPEALRVVAVITFRERVRADAAQTLAYFREQGVGIRVISGDSPRTVAAVARDAGLDIVGEPYDARQLPDDPELIAKVVPDYPATGKRTLQDNGSWLKTLTRDDVALVRVEQLYPWPRALVIEQMQKYANAHLVWCQEEPANAGAWTFVLPRMINILEELKRDPILPTYVGRKASASPATCRRMSSRSSISASRSYPTRCCNRDIQSAVGMSSSERSPTQTSGSITASSASSNFGSSRSGSDAASQRMRARKLPAAESAAGK